jgi:hypothetical protein
MTDELRPMLNSPVESPSVAAEDLVKQVVARLDNVHEAHVKAQAMMAEPPEREAERLAKWKQGVMARFSELTGLEFNQDGKCITPGKVRMEGAFKARWKQMVEEFAAQKDPQKAEQLFGEAGKMLRRAIETPAPTDQDS